MAFWYLSVGVRIAIMFCTHMPPDAWLYKYILHPPYYYSTNTTVDRTISALRFRCYIIIIMSISEIYACCIRFYLWNMSLLSSLQVEMLLKNILFIGKYVVYICACAYKLVYLCV